MIDQPCPLCGKEMYYDGYQSLYECHNEMCLLTGHELFEEYREQLIAQISRIKQEAKQEVFDDVEEISTSYYSGYLKGCRRYFISKFEEIKKKHGVE